MPLSRLIFTFVAAAAAANCVAQEDLSVSSTVSSDQIKAWLAGDDQRLVAWSAYFVSRSQDANNDPAYVTLLQRRMALWITPPTLAMEDREDLLSKRMAMQSVLAALIEKNEAAPIASLTPIAYDFPTESLIMAARLPADELSPFLQHWCDKNKWRMRPDDHTAACIPVAAMLLAKAPPPGFAANVLKQSRERLFFRIVDGDRDLPETNRDEGVDPPCKDSREDTPIAGLSDIPAAFKLEMLRWPPLFTYLLQTSASPYPGTLLVDAAGEEITYRRVPSDLTPTPCYPPPAQFYDYVLRHLLAEMLGTTAESVPWPLYKEVRYWLHDSADFAPALGKQIELEESRISETVQALENKGYLTKEEALAARPRLEVTVYDERALGRDGRRHQPPLPNFISRDPLISVAFTTR